MADDRIPPNPWTGRDFAACLLVVALGVFLAVEPHLAALARYGSAEYLADSDDQYYLAISRPPYYGENTMRDPFAGRWEPLPELHAWLQFVPTANLARALGLRLILVTVLWRVLGGGLLGLALYVLFRRLVSRTSRPTAWALGCTLICLADAGFTDGRSLVSDARLAWDMARGATPMTKADAVPQYRVVTPLTNLAFLVLLAASLVPVRRSWARDAALGAVSLGLCVLLYFFYWTAAVVALGMLIVGYLAYAWRAPGHRPWALAEAKLAAAILAGGLVIGSPQIYSNMRAFNDPEMKAYLQRANRGAKLDPSDPARWLYMRNVWVWGKLAIGAAGIAALRTPGLVPLWCLTLAGYGLANSAIVTRLEFENFHWVLVHAGAGELLLLGTLVAALDRWPPGRGPAWRAAAWAAPVALVAFAAAWRPYEALHAPEAVRYGRLLEGLRPLRPELARLGPDEMLAGPPYAVNAAMLYGRSAVLFSLPYTPATPLPPGEADRRCALNAWLQGEDPEAFAAEAARAAGTSKGRAPGEVGGERIATFRGLLEHPGRGEEWAARYRIGHMLLPAEAPAPRRGGSWTLEAKSGDWALWARTPGPLPEGAEMAGDGRADGVGSLGLAGEAHR
jgi:hypothetical protein